MRESLLKTYLTLLVPAVAGFAAAGLLRGFGIHWTPPEALRVGLAVPSLVAGVACGVALPIFVRARFVHRVSDRQHVDRDRFMRFERRLLQVALTAPYIALAAFVLELARFYVSGTLLAALYAAYFFYPSERRLAFERRIFRVP